MKALFNLFVLLIFIISLDSNAQWIQLETNNTSGLFSISAVNDNVIWSCCKERRVIKTTNGGVNWTIYDPVLPSSYYMGNIYAVNESKAFISGHIIDGNAFCYMTTNGGTNWTQVLYLSSGMVNAVIFKDSNEGILTCDPINNNWIIYKTTNGGNNWNISATFPSLYSETGLANSLDCYGNNVWIGTSFGRVLISSNFGDNWSIVDFGTTKSVSSPHFINAQTGICSGISLLKYTTNAGANWSNMNYPSISPGVGIAGNLNEFIIGVMGTKIYKTTNGGSNWAVEFSLEPSNMVRYHMTKSRDGVYVWDARSNGKVGKRIIPISIRNLSSEMPSGNRLSQNYPNPFNPVTNIVYSLMKSSLATLRVYDALGREIQSLVNEKQAPGTYEAVFDASHIPSGVYFYRLTAEGFSETRKMVVLK